MRRMLSKVSIITVFSATMVGCTRSQDTSSNLDSDSSSIAKHGSVPTVIPDDLTTPEILFNEPEDGNPVTVGAAFFPRQVQPDGLLTLTVKVRILSGWHIYSVDGLNGGNAPTTLNLNLPSSLKPLGPWKCPKAISVGDAHHYKGTITFQRQFSVTAKTHGTIDLSCEVGFQACDPFSCRPQTKLQVIASAEILPIID
jgi:hypothetical protein